MTKQISNHAAAAKMIRAELKKNNIKATVRASSYSMGSSITVTIKQDVLPATREAIESFSNKFQYGHFDGMQDLYEYSNSRDDLPQVKFVFVNCEYSEELKAEARAEAAKWGYKEYELDQAAWRIINGTFESNFWNSRKPRIAA